MFDEADIEEEKFKALVAEKRHKQLMDKFDKMLNALNKEEKNDDGEKIVNAIDKQGEAIKEFAEALKSLGKQEAQEVKVETNQEQVVSSVEQLGINILQGLKELKEEMMKPKEKSEWVHRITKRRDGGNIEEIVSTQK